MDARTPLQALLREEGRRQTWLAERIGMHESQVSRIVNGLIPDEPVKQAIAEALGKSVDELWPAMVPADQAKAA